ncbi:MAG: hypothetical protein KQH83_12570 [Actinobacteria bacterium]|nr:hypothetical protein [Actinomycetota bacterium]
MRNWRTSTWLVVGAVVVAAAAGTAWMLGAPAPPSSEPPPAVAASDDPLALDVLGPGQPGTPVAASLDPGDASPPVAQAVGPGGGEISLDDGLTISVPAGVHPDGAAYTVTARSVEDWSLPDGVVPASALYEIDNGGGYADDVITVRMPVAAGIDPADGFVMGFFWDGTELEGLPFVTADTGSVTVATRHFSSMLLLQVLGITEASVPTVDTGFRPGSDDWQFHNYGSVARDPGGFTARGGHCMGQTLTSIWYFVERHLARSEPHLFGRYDNDGRFPTTALEYDDRLGYRLASTAQVEHTWTWPYVRHAERLAARGDDRSQFLAFATAAYVTREPQVVVIYDTATNLLLDALRSLDIIGFSSDAVPAWTRGHAMVGYGVGTITTSMASVDGIWVADPNHPGRMRVVRWDAARGGFAPYISGDSAWRAGTPFPHVAYYGLSALFDWGALGDLWGRFDQDPGQVHFPALSVTAETDTETGTTTAPLGDSLELSPGDAVLLTVGGTTGATRLYLYDADVLLASFTQDNRLGFEASRTPGTYHLGLYVAERTTCSGAPCELFVDFIRFDVVVAGPRIMITPDPVVEAAPGARVPLDVDIQNLGTQPVTVTLHSGRSLEGGCADADTVAAGAVVRRTCHVIAPAESGDYPFTITALGTDPAGVQASTSMEVYLIVTAGADTTTSTTQATAAAGPLRIALTTEPGSEVNVTATCVVTWDGQSHAPCPPGRLQASRPDASTEVWADRGPDDPWASWVVLTVDTSGDGGSYTLEVTEGGDPSWFVSTGQTNPLSIPRDRVAAGDFAYAEVRGATTASIGEDETHFYLLYHDGFGEATGIWAQP